MTSAVPWPSAVARTDPRPPDVLLRAVPVRHDRLQTGAVLGGQLDLDPFAHPRDVGMSVAEGNPPLDAIH
jgi:hypothetical protein